MAGLDLDMPAALATAREMGATGWAALPAPPRAALIPPGPDHPTDAGGVTHGR
jgi:hypothetical protein